MKILEQSTREGSGEWFAKQGFSLHGIVLYFRDPDSGNTKEYHFDAWADNESQDWVFVATHLQVTFAEIKLMQDNNKLPL